MQFLIASTFQDSLTKLQTSEQQAAKLAAIELQMNPANPGLQMHRIERARDRSFWSARVNDDLRLIVHKTEASLLLCYVDHHDSAYGWAEGRKLTVHPTTGAAQMVVLKETVREIVVPRYVEEPTIKSRPGLPLLAAASDIELLSYGVPVDWLESVRGANDEDAVLEIAEQLPEEAREAVLSLAIGRRPSPAPVVENNPTPGADVVATPSASFAHPDAQRRFRAVANLDELKAALDAPWETWAVFLHPAQRAVVERDFSGPARVTGSAGTGKTIVALHRAVNLAEANPGSRVRLLIANRPRLAEQIEVLSFEAVARRLYEKNLIPVYGQVRMAKREEIEGLILDAVNASRQSIFPERFFIAEWDQVIDAGQLRTWEEYRDHARVGRRSRLREPQRQILWGIFSRVLKALEERSEMTVAQMFARLAEHYQNGGVAPFEFAVVDEAQDVSQAELRCLAALGGGRRNALFFAGDTAQRIFQTPFSWKANGVEVRGRSTNLKVNYRTSQEIREYADRLLDPEISDADGNVEERLGTLSVFNGPAPEIKAFESVSEEAAYVGKWLREKSLGGMRPDEMVIFVRSEAQVPRAEDAARHAGLPYQRLTQQMTCKPGCLIVCPMHLAKGLEFRAVAVMACDQDALPDPERIATAGDPTELEEVYTSERQLLYVACTRARDALIVSSAGAASEFVDDMKRGR